MYQSTIAKSISLEGIGLHSGMDVKVKCLPAAPYSGIVFFIHSDNQLYTLSPRPNLVSTTELATTLSNGKVQVSTVEHILAAISGLEIDNIQVHIYGNEIPILDGSALGFVHSLEEAGKKLLPFEKKFAWITKPVTFSDNHKSITARPHNGFFIDYVIDFPHSLIGRQRYSLEMTPDTFKEVAAARTFGFAREVEYLHSKGLALGGSLANAIVIDDEGVVNPDGLRFEDEFVRHKILDFIGDMAMFGMPIKGAFEVKYSGHKHNNEFLRFIETSEALNYAGVFPVAFGRKTDIFSPVAVAAYSA